MARVSVSGAPPDEVFRACSTGRRPRGRPQVPPRRAGRSVWVEGGLGMLRLLPPQKRKMMEIYILCNCGVTTAGKLRYAFCKCDEMLCSVLIRLNLQLPPDSKTPAYYIMYLLLTF